MGAKRHESRGERATRKADPSDKVGRMNLEEQREKGRSAGNLLTCFSVKCGLWVSRGSLLELGTWKEQSVGGW